MDAQLDLDLEMLVVAPAGLNIDAEFDLRPLGQAGGRARIFEGQILDVLAHHLKIGEMGLTIAFARHSDAAHSGFPVFCGPRATMGGGALQGKGVNSAPCGVIEGATSGPGGALGARLRAMFGPLEMPDTQLIAILVAAMVAGIVLFKLYTILGRRTGHEPQPQDRIAPPQPSSALRTPSAPTEPQARSLFDIQLADPSF